jgi:hypothetical protein
LRKFGVVFNIHLGKKKQSLHFIIYHGANIHDIDKPVSDRDHEVLGMGSFGEYYKLYGKST